jgi:hypothetical protein
MTPEIGVNSRRPVFVTYECSRCVIRVTGQDRAEFKWRS